MNLQNLTHSTKDLRRLLVEIYFSTFFFFSQADLKEMSTQLHELWMESLVSVRIPRNDAQQYCDAFIQHNMDFASLVTLTKERLVELNITNPEHQSHLMELRTIATQLPTSGDSINPVPSTTNEDEEEEAGLKQLAQLAVAPAIARRDSDLSQGWSQLIEPGKKNDAN